MKDKRLVIKLKSGDEKALSKIMDKYMAYAYTIAKNVIGAYMTKEDIEEVISDSFVALWRNSYKINEEYALAPYIAAIVRNQSKNKLREYRCDLPLDELGDVLYDYKGAQSDLMETVKMVMEAAATLKDTEREIFIRHCWYGEKLDDIAKLLGLTLSNCKTKLCRTKVKIRKYLIERGYGYEEK